MLEIKRNSTISLRHLREFLEERDQVYADEADAAEVFAEDDFEEETDSGIDSLTSSGSSEGFDNFVVEERNIFEEVPEKLNFIGLITHYKEIQRVQWQKEILITISQGGDEVLEVSYLANQDDPSQTNFNGVDYKGKVIFLKRVNVTDFDFTNGNEMLFQAHINNDVNEFRHIIVPLTDPNSVNRFLTDPGQEPFFVDLDASVVPKIIKKKKVGERFPLLSEDINATRDIILQLVEFYSTVRRFYDDSKEKIDFFIGTNHFKNTIFYHLAELRDTRTIEFENLNNYATKWLQSATVAVKMHADLVEYTNEDIPLAEFCKMRIGEETES